MAYQVTASQDKTRQDEQAEDDTGYHVHSHSSFLIKIGGLFYCMRYNPFFRYKKTLNYI